jgi:hypothetical protein
MQVGDHKETLELILHPHIVAHSAKIIAEVKKSGRPDSAHNCRFSPIHKDGKDRGMKDALKRLKGAKSWAKSHYFPME